VLGTRPFRGRGRKTGHEAGSEDAQEVSAVFEKPSQECQGYPPVAESVGTEKAKQKAVTILAKTGFEV